MQEKKNFLPQTAKRFFVNRLYEISGILFFLLSVFLFLSLYSYNPADPSLNTAIDQPSTNFFGIFGSYASDFLLQSVGLISLSLVLVFIGWSWQFITHRKVKHLVLKFLSILFMLVIGATAIAFIPWKEGSSILWPIHASYGGGIGWSLKEYLTQISFLPGWVQSAYFLASVLGSLTLALFVYNIGLSGREWVNIFQFFKWIVKSISRAIFLLLKAISRLFKNKEETDNQKEKTKKISSDKTKGAVPAQLVARKPVKKKRSKQSKKSEQDDDISFEIVPNSLYQLPSLSLLEKPKNQNVRLKLDKNILSKQAEHLKKTLSDFGVKGEIVDVKPGPVVTLFELEPVPGTKTSRVISLADDIARSMSAISVRVATIPGRSVIGIEMPNTQRETVFLKSLLSSEVYENTASKLPLVLGKDIGGEPIIIDLARMPHLLMAGTTGSGKSVSINTLILSLLYRLPPDQCRMIMIDPKMLELSVYDGIPHLLSPVVTDPGKAIMALKWAVREMESRYRSMSKLGVRNIIGYNQKIRENLEKGEALTRRVQTGFNTETGEAIYEDQPMDLKELPYIVVVVDEIADLMMLAGKDVEAAIQRLAQMARAAGIHLILATQRPSVDVITGTIKANLPSRISFQVTSKIDSRTILGEQGAEQLLGQGDMLYMAPGGRLTRVHGPFTSDTDVEKVVNYLKSQGEPQYLETITEEMEEQELDFPLSQKKSGDDLYDRALQIVMTERKASISFIQRQLQIGYNRAANIVEKMEQEGVLGAPNRMGRREILIGEKNDE